ncbi:hypothetical protein OIO90_006348 [Microbotryomycetes sp. JL221]|nr:hypothetical protein OIO90_006348 [Microbotryomycetes sp. JL221]
MSSSDSVPLPEPPPGVNPFIYWYAVVDSFVHPPLPSGYRIVLAAIDHKRRNRGFWLWRLTKRHEGNYIVGNLQWLEPILIVMVCIVEILHVDGEWRASIEGNLVRDVNVLRVAPFTVVLVFLWITSWAALQSYILAAGDHHRAIRLLKPKVANALFVGIGTLSTIVLIVLDVVTSIDSRRAYDALQELLVYLGQTAALADAGATPIGAPERATQLWNHFLDDSTDNTNVIRALLIFFAIFPILTFLVDLGAFGLLFTVRRQIKSTYGRYNKNLLQGDEFEIVSCPSQFKASGDLESPRGSVSNGPHQASSIGLVITEASRIEESRSVTIPLGTGDPTSSHTNSLMSQIVPSVATTGAKAPQKQEGLPSRARVRQLAVTEQGNAVGERAKGLARLQKAEMDLLITACSMSAMSVSFVALCIWVAVSLDEILSLPPFASEASVVLATYVFVIIATVTVTLRLQHTRINMRHNAARRASVIALQNSNGRKSSEVNMQEASHLPTAGLSGQTTSVERRLI